jgi:hypothetical protein
MLLNPRNLAASTWEGWVKFDSAAGTQTIYSETAADGTVYKLEQVNGKLKWVIGKEGVPGESQFVEVPLQQPNNSNITTPGVADLVITNLTAPTNASWGSNINISWTVQNQGANNANADWTDSVWVSDKSYWDSTATLVVNESVNTQTPLVTGGSVT